MNTPPRHHRCLQIQILYHPAGYAKNLITNFLGCFAGYESVYGAQLQWAFSAIDVAAALEEPLEFYAERDRVYIADRVRSCIHWQAGKL